MNTEQENQLAILAPFLAANGTISVKEGDRYTSATQWYRGILESVDMSNRNLNVMVTRNTGYVQRTNINQEDWKPGTVTEKRTIEFDNIRMWHNGTSSADD